MIPQVGIVSRTGNPIVKKMDQKRWSKKFSRPPGIHHKNGYEPFFILTQIQFYLIRTKSAQYSVREILRKGRVRIN